MKTVYDARTHTLVVEFRKGPVAESGEEKLGVILDSDLSRNIVTIEILDASKRAEQVRCMQFEVAP